MLTRRRFSQAASAMLGGAIAGPVMAAERASAKVAGFRVPDEAGPHERTFMQWPVSVPVYGSRSYLTAVQGTIAELANTVAEFEPVVMLMGDEYIASARPQLSDIIEIWAIPTEDLWCRDSGPIFVTDGKGELAVTQLNFNGWGNRQIHRRDGLVAGRVAERMGLSVYDNGLVGEGGGVEVDGDGTLLAHASSWVNPNRNAGSAAEIDGLLLEAYGAEKTIWAPGLMGQDITDYHIDALARFIEPGKVLIQLPEKVDPGDPFSRADFQTYEILQSATDAKGRKLDLTVLPSPVDIRSNSWEFVASYVNYYICNGAVIIAEFGDRAADEEAVRVLGNLYPDREIIALNVDPVAESGGGVHCTTQQQPRV